MQKKINKVYIRRVCDFNSYWFEVIAPTPPDRLFLDPMAILIMTKRGVEFFDYDSTLGQQARDN